MANWFEVSDMKCDDMGELVRALRPLSEDVMHCVAMRCYGEDFGGAHQIAYFDQIDWLSVVDRLRAHCSAFLIKIAGAEFSHGRPTEDAAGEAKHEAQEKEKGEEQDIDPACQVNSKQRQVLAAAVDKVDVTFTLDDENDLSSWGVKFASHMFKFEHFNRGQTKFSEWQALANDCATLLLDKDHGSIRAVQEKEGGKWLQFTAGCIDEDNATVSDFCVPFDLLKRPLQNALAEARRQNLEFQKE